jgi:hypothetical protein
MQSSRKTKRIVSALSMAAAAALATNAAFGVTLTMYYGNDPNYSNSNNAIIIGNGFTPSYSAATFDQTGSPEYFANHTNVPVSQTGPTTITMPVGDYLSLAIDAILTGNVNPQGGVDIGLGTKPSNHQVQPSYLGLSSLEINIRSTDTYATTLTPISTGGPEGFAPNNGTTYNSTAAINTKGSTPHLGANSGSSGGAYNVVPNWINRVMPGYVEPNEPGFDSGTMASGEVGVIDYPFGGTTNDAVGVAPNTITGVQEVEQFAASNDVASYANATEFLDSLIYQGLSPGMVTLSPGPFNPVTTNYWSLTTPGSETSLPQYSPTNFTNSDTVNNLPPLVIDVVAQPVPEPTSLGLLVLGGIGLLHRRNRGSS